MSIFSLSGKTVLITGGNGYLGTAVVRGLAEHGATVAVADLDVRDHGHERVHAIACDVSDSASIRRAFRQASGLGGRIDVLINCATYGAATGRRGPSSACPTRIGSKAWTVR
ncbi:SDR family NAD(P)-dependent oxidoreductase [Gordoniibacillus kamchatkensis]|uniref:SDR family NAD(P)-dependent oxidoreductase n=1 Tax=Gordoniibacillus kamchatkensis TaxID=1590651 RepID=UPI000A434C86|nr:SDR family NAD(P)-dependent oxidoreductase [Paenibacillus sp. VKM B-2647]